MEIKNLDANDLKRCQVFLQGELIEGAECVSFDEETGRAVVKAWGGLYLLDGGKITHD